MAHDLQVHDKRGVAITREKNRSSLATGRCCWLGRAQPLPRLLCPVEPRGADVTFLPLHLPRESIGSLFPWKPLCESRETPRLPPPYRTACILPLPTFQAPQLRIRIRQSVPSSHVAVLEVVALCWPMLPHTPWPGKF